MPIQLSGQNLYYEFKPEHQFALTQPLVRSHSRKTNCVHATTSELYWKGSGFPVSIIVYDLKNAIISTHSLKTSTKWTITLYCTEW